MPYAVAIDLLTRAGAMEIAQVATPKEYSAISPDLLRATINGDDRSSWSAEEIAAADAALERIQAALTDAENDINMHLGARYALPLDPVPANLSRIACDIARFRLYEKHAPEEVRDRYKDAIRFLEFVAIGKLPLGVDEPQATVGAPQFKAPGRKFTHDSLEDY